MKPASSARVRTPAKAATGITGLDEITGGGLPRGRTTLLLGGPGSGKTILALKFLVHGARNCKEPGIFVAFEETSKRIAANADGFGWGIGKLRAKSLFFLDAQPAPDLVHSGEFDLTGMLAALGAQAKAMGAKRIVFDVRAKSLQTELIAKQTEKALLAHTTDIRKSEQTRGRARMGELRGSDAPSLRRKSRPA